MVFWEVSSIPHSCFEKKETKWWNPFSYRVKPRRICFPSFGLIKIPWKISWVIGWYCFLNTSVSLMCYFYFLKEVSIFEMFSKFNTWTKSYFIAPNLTFKKCVIWYIDIYVFPGYSQIKYFLQWNVPNLIFFFQQNPACPSVPTSLLPPSYDEWPQTWNERDRVRKTKMGLTDNVSSNNH